MGRTPWIITVLRFEGLALGLLCIWLYRSIHEPWWYFALLFLAPDLSLLGYLAGPRIGAVVYNVVHTWIAPSVLFVLGWWGSAWLRALGVDANVAFLLPIAFILGAHIGIDRALGLGLKLPSGFRDTHLGRIGRSGSDA
jgi:hypothetical protein